MSIESPDSNSPDTNPIESGAVAAETAPAEGAANIADAQDVNAISESETDAASTEGDQAEEPEKITDPKLMDRFECRSCGYIYEPVKGDDSTGIDAGTPFEEIYASWKCPVCTAPKRRFSNVGPAGNPSGFKENLGYGFGVNVMTPGQKNLLIFGSLLLGFLFFLSLYGLK